MTKIQETNQDIQKNKQDRQQDNPKNTQQKKPQNTQQKEPATAPKSKPANTRQAKSAKKTPEKAQKKKPAAAPRSKPANTRQAKPAKKAPEKTQKKEMLSSRQRREQEVHHAKVMIACGIAAFLVILSLILVLPRLAGSKTVNKGELTGVNTDVLQYKDTVEAYCKEYKISQFSTLILAMMQQESSGQGTDVLQCSESPFNTEYPNSPGSITDPDYSIRVGVETFAYCLKQAGCKRISDMDGVKLALQEYNFGNDYANWALSNYGGYSEASAYEFSEMMKIQLGWDTYGDPQYVSHVLNYYRQ